VGPGPHLHPGDGHGARTAETSGWAGVQQRVCRGRRNGSPGTGAHAGEGGAGPALCRDAETTSQAQVSPSGSSLPCGRPLCSPTHQERKEGYIPTGVLPCASAQGPSPARHRGPRTLSPDVVIWEVQAGEAVCVRVWLGAAGVPAFLGPSPIQRGHFSPASDTPVGAGAGASPLKSGLESLPTWSMLSGQGGCHWLTPGAGSILVRNCLPVRVASRPPGAPLPGQISAAPGESRFPRQSPRVWKHVSSGSLKLLKWPSFPELGFAGSLRTEIKSREQGPPGSVGAPCLALCPHCQAPHHRGGCTLSLSTGQEPLGAPGWVKTPHTDCVCVRACACVRVALRPSILHVAHLLH